MYIIPIMKNPECGCIIHPGQTHEEHMDELDKRLNREMIERAIVNKTVTPALYRAFCEAEIRRLQEKERNMRLGKIRTK